MYNNGIFCLSNWWNFLKQGCVWIILLGSFASSSDTMMRLIYQKYRATAREKVDKKIILPEEDKRTDYNYVGSFRVRLEAEHGIRGLLLIVILIASISMH